MENVLEMGRVESESPGAEFQMGADEARLAWWHGDKNEWTDVPYILVVESIRYNW